MENVDYIIVGDGYAAMFFAHQLIKNNKSFRLFSEAKVAASHISAGVCNPVVLKRFVEIWNAKPQMDYLDVIFNEIESYTDKNYLIKENVARVFHDEIEKDLWLKKAEKEELKDYLNKDFIKLNNVENIHSAGLVNDSCRIDVTGFFQDMFLLLEKSGWLIKEQFSFDTLDLKLSQYKNINFKNIIFAEGIAVNDNPHFKNVDVRGNKGHCLKLKLDGTIDPYVIKKKYFLFKFSEDTYYCGGTYERFETDLEVNPESVAQLEKGLKEIYKGNYSIEKVQTAFRSVVPDRRPIVGAHPEHKNMFILNGLGARGVLNGSFFSKVLYDFIEEEKEINPEVDVNRFF